MKEEVILVNIEDEPIGLMEKMEAHQRGLLHRAFSVFLFNDAGELLLQRRALKKYHSGGLWTNTCCSHPRDKENLQEAGRRRLKEEMGFTTDLKPVHSIIYKANLDNEMIEHEFDHILVGKFNGVPLPNIDEVVDWKFVDLETIQAEINKTPDVYTVWFKLIFSESIEILRLNR